ncbi:MAG: DUF92 domain-containing protein [Spirochaetes bacterium]|uniref:DUF92 domain-containing protein n=1 Tax=Candidatus Ornithospirochaeta stercoripullorum TaxID=2840899 RepID=A0A9D9H5S2_9SPIO|nr:DUF92 domain-containing protein [Candidatus Ornithospirochaeta stercoripullorum]
MRSWTLYLDSLFFSLSMSLRVVLILVLMAIAALIALKARFLTRSGTLAAVLLGFVVMYTGAVSGLVMFLFFFISASSVSRIVHPNKERNGRDMAQVVANGLPAALSLVLYRLSSYPEAFLIAFASCLAEAEADTLSGEIGSLSHKDPVSIVTFTRVPKGISGGITVLGLSAGVLSSLLIALLFMGTFTSSISSVLIITSTGFLGSVFDSLLGATLQAAYRRKDGSLTEAEIENGEKNERVRGIRWIDNDAVNFLSGLFAFSLSSVFAIIL